MTENTASGVNLTFISGARAEQFLYQKFSMLLMSTAFGRNAAKYGA
jgi:hypothetical protein